MSDLPIDPTVFAELQDAMGPEFVAELVTTFFAEAPAMLAELTGAADAGDKDNFRRAAHSIKSNADIFGAADLVALARQMELSGLSEDPDQNAAQIISLTEHYERAAADLKGLIDG
jgi:histidine phosphotransfer protein HptB